MSIKETFRRERQKTVIENVLSEFHSQTLTPDVIKEIEEKMFNEMFNGIYSSAFK